MRYTKYRVVITRVFTISAKDESAAAQEVADEIKEMAYCYEYNDIMDIEELK